MLRHRLIDLLDASMSRPVTVVCAGAGWGKTALVSAWAAAGRLPAAWLSLDESDNDPEVFWTNVAAALRAAGAVPPDSSLAPHGDVPENAAVRIRDLIRGLGRLPTPTVLVLDDFHRIRDRPLIRDLAGLLRTPQTGFRLVLISRSQPALPLHRQRLQGELSEVRSDDLAFTAEEAAELFATRGLRLRHDDVMVLVKRTEGWAAGLQFAATFLTESPGRRTAADFAGDVRPVEGYLTEEMLALQSPRTRRFLLYTSICDHLCGELADAVTQRIGGQRTLERLEQAEQFVVRRGVRPHWFRYHYLVRDVLRHRLAVESPAMVPQLHLRAAQWYALHGLTFDALHHAAAAEDWRYVGRLIVGAAPMVLSADRDALVRILEQVPAEQFGSTAELVMCAAIRLYFSGDYDSIPRRLGEARDLLAGHPEGEGLAVEVAIRALETAVHRIRGDMPAVVENAGRLITTLTRAPLTRLPSMLQYRAIALNSQGVGLLWTDRPEEAVRSLWVSATAARTVGVEMIELSAISHLALLEVLSGSVREAERLVRRARDLADQHGWRDVPQAVPADLAAALVEIERNHLSAAHRAVQHGLREHRVEPETADRAMWLGIKARLMVTEHDLSGASALLDEANRQRSGVSRMPTLERWLLRLESEANLMAGRPDLVESRYGDPDRRTTLTFPERILLARAAFAGHDLHRAEALLGGPGAMMAETVASVEAGVLTALVADAAGQGPRAADVLAQSVALAAREGIRRP
ncbi:MAG TPA: AAA family ATPase, partial [Actinoplanes sp.]|nr:AAA family ATPase [Actinoplanes sp.]